MQLVNRNWPGCRQVDLAHLVWVVSSACKLVACSPLTVLSTTAGEERSTLYRTLLGVRRQRPACGRGSLQLLTCARVTALCLSFITGLLLVVATRYPPRQEGLKDGVQRAGELLQNVRTPAFEVGPPLRHHVLIMMPMHLKMWYLGTLAGLWLFTSHKAGSA